MEKKLITEVNRISELMGINNILSEGPSPFGNWFKNLFKKDAALMSGFVKKIETTGLSKAEKDVFESAVSKLENPSLGKLTTQENNVIEGIIRTKLDYDGLAKEIINNNYIPKAYRLEVDNLITNVRLGRIDVEDAIDGVRRSTMAIQNQPKELLEKISDEFEAEIKLAASDAQTTAAQKMTSQEAKKLKDLEDELARKNQQSKIVQQGEMFVRQGDFTVALNKLEGNIDKIMSKTGTKMNSVLGKNVPSIRSNIKQLKKLNVEYMDVLTQNPTLKIKLDGELDKLKAVNPNAFHFTRAYMSENPKTSILIGLALVGGFFGWGALQWLTNATKGMDINKCLECAQMTDEQLKNHPECGECKGLKGKAGSGSTTNPTQTDTGEKKCPDGSLPTIEIENGQPVYFCNGVKIN